MKYSPEDITKNNKIYKAFLSLGLDDGWGSKDKQENFKLMMQICDYTNTQIKDASVLDVGCGTGDMIAFLQKQDIGQYIGIDLFEKAIQKAQKRFPDERFILSDFLSADLPKVDFVLCSGALTSSLDSDNYDILKAWVIKMWDLAKKGVVFNLLLENYPGEKTLNLFLYDRQRVLEIVLTALPDAEVKTVITDAGSGDESREMHLFLY